MKGGRKKDFWKRRGEKREGKREGKEDRWGARRGEKGETRVGVQ